jgi:hypothetical protein
LICSQPISGRDKQMLRLYSSSPNNAKPNVGCRHSSLFFTFVYFFSNFTGVYCINAALCCKNTAVYSINAALCCKIAAVYSMNAAHYCKITAVYSINTAHYCKITAVYSINAAHYCKITAVYSIMSLFPKLFHFQV